MRMFRCYPIERSMDDRVRHLKRHFTSTEYAPLKKELISNNDVQNKWGRREGGRELLERSPYLDLDITVYWDIFVT